MKNNKNIIKETSYNVDFSSNKVSKIIFLKKLLPVLVAFVIAILYLVSKFFTLNSELASVKDDIKDINSRIVKEKKTYKFYMSENTRLENEILQLKDTSVNTDIVNMLAHKVAELIKIKGIIKSYTIHTARSNEFANVVNLSMQVEGKNELVSQEVLKNIFYVVFADVFHIKEVAIKDDLIVYTIYKEVK